MVDFGVDSVTILKYRLGTTHHFKVLDKFNEPDEVQRLELMIKSSEAMSKNNDDYEELWIKTCPIFPATDTSRPKRPIANPPKYIHGSF